MSHLPIKASSVTGVDELHRALYAARKDLNELNDKLKAAQVLLKDGMTEYAAMHRYYWNGYRELDSEPFVKRCRVFLSIPFNLKFTYEGLTMRGTDREKFVSAQPSLGRQK